MPSDEYINTKIIPFKNKNYQKFTAAYNMMYIQPYREYLKKKLPIIQPALVLWGQEDYIFGNASHAKELCKNLEQSKFCKWYSVPNAGHLLLKEDNNVLQVIAQYYSNFLNFFIKK